MTREQAPLCPLLIPRPVGLRLEDCAVTCLGDRDCRQIHLESQDQGVRSLATVGFSPCDSRLGKPLTFGRCPDLGPTVGLEAVNPGHTDTLTDKRLSLYQVLLNLRHMSHGETVITDCLVTAGTRRPERLGNVCSVTQLERAGAAIQTQAVWFQGLHSALHLDRASAAWVPTPSTGA